MNGNITTWEARKYCWKILALAREIEKEDKTKPYTDDELADELKKKGYPIARRTVAKYRQQLNIPIARLRR